MERVLAGCPHLTLLAADQAGYGNLCRLTSAAHLAGTKAVRPEKGGCCVEWNFDVTSGIPLLGERLPLPVRRLEIPSLVCRITRRIIRCSRP